MRAEADFRAVAPGVARPGDRRPWHRVAALTGGALAVVIAGCAAAPVRDRGTDGSYCYRVNAKSRHPTCLAQGVPSAAEDSAVKNSLVDGSAFTVVVVRRRWSDAVNVVDLELDGRTVAATLPQSFVRLRLAPGPHRVAVQWADRRTELALDGAAAELMLIELVGSTFVGASHYGLKRSDVESAARRVEPLRLVADIDLR